MLEITFDKDRTNFSKKKNFLKQTKNAANVIFYVYWTNTGLMDHIQERLNKSDKFKTATRMFAVQ